MVLPYSLHLLLLFQDGDIKVCLEGMAWAIDEISKPDFAVGLQRHCAQILAPSPSFLIVAEALFVLQSGNDKFFSPEKTLTPFSWRAMQRFLASPTTLVSNLRTISRGTSTPELCEVLRHYIKNIHWPMEDTEFRKSNRIMHVMAYFVESFVQCETMTRVRGGAPFTPLSRGAMKGIQTVVMVSDIPPGDPEDIMQGGETSLGWRMPCWRMIRACLQDLRVLKTAMKIDKKTYNVSVYREEATIYFDAYDPVTSQLFMTTLVDVDAPQLMSPNALMKSKGTFDPPTTSQELYTRLAKLLHIGKAMRTKDARRMLYLQRDFSFLRSLTGKLNGHFLQLKLYEAALGELHFTAYIPEYSAWVQLNVDENERLRLYQNCDEELEHEVIEAEDAKLLMPFVLDRLRLTPSRNMIDAKGFGYKNPRLLQRQGLMSNIKSQGFLLKVNCGGGAGALIRKTIVKFAGVHHVLVVKSSTPTKTLRILAYEPRLQRKMELRLSGFVRKILTGTDSDNIKLWDQSFWDRLKVQWRGKHTLWINASVYRGVHKVGGRRLVVSIEPMTEENIKVILTDCVISQKFVMILPKEDVNRLFYYVAPAEEVKRDFGFTAMKEGLKNILSGMKQSISLATLTSDSAKSGKASSTGYFDPALLEGKLETILQNKDNLRKLAGQFELLLKRKSKTDIYAGYEGSDSSPIGMSFEPQNLEEEKVCCTFICGHGY